MEFNQNNNDESKQILNQIKPIENIENLKYLYPNGHRATNQMKWFKGSRDRCFKSDIAA
mgnify:CR=1 FL=1|tara:strand:+ start:218 stop:394 length:177 start_codon:yes stop_codon:yes gene_type:complete